MRRRDICSELLAISDAAYEVGVHRLERELVDGSAPPLCTDHLCLLTLRGDKPSRGFA